MELKEIAVEVGHNEERPSDNSIVELSELQLAFIGGGGGDVVFH
ncbi:MAG TPA: hypothetical protein VM166_07375 [Gemmatimonadaceae bacterium]|nr:hypothetical protein [Gemmatimonadaceae bacterium]